MSYLVNAVTDIGNVKQTNQDSFFSIVANTAWGEMAFAVICDGMGGLQKGEVASNSVSLAFERWAKDFFRKLSAGSLLEVLKREWTLLAESYNRKIMEYGLGENIKLGTTLTVVLLHNNRYYLLNVGDTRCYLLHENLFLLTHDHTLVQREMDQGILTPEQAHVDPRRNVLLQCVGASERLLPDFYTGEYLPGDAFLLCSDGFRHEISEDEIYQILVPDQIISEEVMGERLRYLVDMVKSRQEKDNITALMIKAE